MSTHKAPQLPTAIILGLSPTGLYVARELGLMGVSLLGVDKSLACAQFSRFFRRGYGVLQEADATNLLTKLVTFSKSSLQKPVLIPTSDHYIEFVIEHHQELAQYFVISEGYQSGAALTLLDKQAFNTLCLSEGLAVPNVWEATAISELNEIEDLIFPCILKPSMIHLAKAYMKGKKVFVLNDRSDLINKMNEIPASSGSWLLQEIIPGPESNITLLAANRSQQKAEYECFSARKLRQYPPGFGSASLVVAEPCEETERVTRKLIDALDYQGIFGAEFKLDPRDGKLKIIEINPRPTLWFYASHAADKRIVETTYRDLCGLEPLPEQSQKNGVVWCYYLKDMASAWFYRINGSSFVFPEPELSKFNRSGKKCYPVFSWSDPMPFFGELLVFFTKFIRRLF